MSQSYKTRWVGTIQLDYEIPAKNVKEETQSLCDLFTSGFVNGAVRDGVKETLEKFFNCPDKEGSVGTTKVSVTQTYADRWNVPTEDENGTEI